MTFLNLIDIYKQKERSKNYEKNNYDYCNIIYVYNNG